jgi:hypothetical protein
MNTSSKNITLALQELGFNVTSIQQMTAKCLSSEGPINTTSLPIFLVDSDMMPEVTDNLQPPLPGIQGSFCIAEFL